MLACAMTALAQEYRTYLSQMERLDRGIVALPAAQKGVFVSWRLLGTDPQGITFDLLRDGMVSFLAGTTSIGVFLLNVLRGEYWTVEHIHIPLTTVRWVM